MQKGRMGQERQISDLFKIVGNQLRSLTKIHEDEAKLKSCFADAYPRVYDKYSIACYAFNLPALAFLEENRKLREIAIENSELFSAETFDDPIFFYAYVGQGKTTYLRHLVMVRMKDDPVFQQFHKKVYFAYASFMKDTTDLNFIVNRVEDELDRVMRNIKNDHGIADSYATLSEIFAGDREWYEVEAGEDKNEKAFRAAILERWGKSGYRQKFIGWLRDVKKIKICFVLDNVDQHFKYIPQSKIAQVVHDVISTGTQVVLPLRVSNRGLQSDTLFDSYSPVAIRLDIPNFGEILRKRNELIIKYIHDVLKDPIWKTDDGSYIYPDEVASSLRGIASYIEKVAEVNISMQMLSNYIPREYLRIMINNYSAKPLFFHPLTGKKIDYAGRLKDGNFHSLFIYSLMLRNSRMHDEDDLEIPIINLFQNPAVKSFPKFFRYYLLLLLYENRHVMLSVQDFTHKFLAKYRASEDEVKKTIRFMGIKRCLSIKTPEEIESYNNLDDLQLDNCIIAISPRGRYHLELMEEIEYYEILAIPQLLDWLKTIQNVDEAYKTQRGKNLKRYLDELKNSESNIKQWLKGKNAKENFRSHMLWTNNVFPKIEKQLHSIFQLSAH